MKYFIHRVPPVSLPLSQHWDSTQVEWIFVYKILRQIFLCKSWDKQNFIHELKKENINCVARGSVRAHIQATWASRPILSHPMKNASYSRISQEWYEEKA